MKNNKQQKSENLQEIGISLEDIARRGARQMIQQAIEIEVTAFLENFQELRTQAGHKAVVRNGHLPARDILTGIGALQVQVPKVRDRAGLGIKFNSVLAPPYVRKAKSVQACLPWLYLKGISTGDIGPALSVLLGEDAQGLSANVVCRLKQQWAEEHAIWNRRDLSNAYYVYWWVDGIHAGLRSDDSDGQCLLVIIGVKADGRKERVVIGEGYRESTDAWKEILLDLKARGLKIGPMLAVGDGAMGFWAALAEVYPNTKMQRCWFHKIGNVLNTLPKSMQGRAKTDLKDIWMAENRRAAKAALKRFDLRYSAKYPKAVDKLCKDQDELLAFYDFPAEHWQHLRTTNPIESTFATVRHRTTRTRNCVSRSTFLGLAFKLMEEAEKSWLRIKGADKIALLLRGVTFEDGEAVHDDPPARLRFAA